MPPVPDWISIKDFSRDLLHIHDQDDIPEEFKVKIARSIANLRDEKQSEAIAESNKELTKIIFRQNLWIDETLVTLH